MADSHKEIRKAVTILRKGGLVAFPTETVYGLGADAKNADAVRKIFAAKKRPVDHPLIVHLADANALGHWGQDMPHGAYVLAEKFWPGPLTLVVERASHVLDVVTGAQQTVALRVPAHPLALELLRAFGGAIAAPSANMFGHLSPTSAQHVRAEFGDEVGLVLEGGTCAVGIESTIIDMSSGQPAILRPGHIRAEQIELALGIKLSVPVQDAPRVSGTLASHYAPRTPLILVHPDEVDTVVKQRSQEGPVAVLARRVRPGNSRAALWQIAPAVAADYAQHLYALLRRADESGCNIIVVEDLPRLPEWLAARDRLGRAASEIKDKY